jgi:hypothetical protein
VASDQERSCSRLVSYAQNGPEKPKPVVKIPVKSKQLIASASDSKAYLVRFRFETVSSFLGHTL